MDLTVNFGVAEGGKLDCSSSIVVFHSYYRVKMQVIDIFTFQNLEYVELLYGNVMVELKINLIFHNHYI